MNFEEKRKHSLQEDWDRIFEHLEELKKDYDSETRTSEKRRLLREIEKVERDLQQKEEQLKESTVPPTPQRDRTTKLGNRSPLQFSTWTLLGIVAVVCVALVGAFTIRGWYEDRQHQRALAYNLEGTEFNDQGQLYDARQAFQKAREADPAFAEAVANLAMVEVALGNEASASELLLEAIELEPENETHHYNLGTLRARQGYPVEVVIKHFDHAVALNPQYAEAFNEAGNAYLAERMFEKARTSFESGLACGPAVQKRTRAVLHKNLGRCLLLEAAAGGSVDLARRAIPHLKEAFQPFGDDVQGTLESTFRLAQAYEQLGETEEVCDHLRRFESYSGSQLTPWWEEAVAIGERSECPISSEP